MLDIGSVDLDGLAEALADNSGDEHRWLFDPRTGTTEVWPTEPWGGVADEDEDPEENRLLVEPLPSWVWYQDMVDFAELVSDEKAGRRLARALDGRGAFRRFRNELHDEYPDLVSAWNTFSDRRGAVRAARWLWDNDVISEQDLDRYVAEHPDPAVP